MRPAKDQKIEQGPTAKLEVHIDAKVVQALDVMEKYAKISKTEIVSIALKRYIAAHSDYFPQDYKA